MQSSYRFGTFELRPWQRALVQAGKPVALGGRAYDVLLALVERCGALVSRHELLDLVWGRTVVEDSNLHVQISTLRKVLGPSAIATVPGRGYRFESPLERVADEGSVAEMNAASTPARTLADPQPDLLPPPLLGRQKDLAALTAEWPMHRLVTVVGSGGVGKTRLARAALARRRNAHADGVAVVELAALTDAALIPGAIAVALQLDLGGASDPLAALAQATRHLDLLLLLDNAEHLADGVARVAQALWHEGRGPHLLVTSQRSLKLPHERLYRLGGLAVPLDGVDLAEAASHGAVALFVERVQALDRRFALTDANLSLVVAICRHLDGIPLTLELAAARCPLLGLQALAANLSERFRLLSVGSRAAPSRHQTLQAAMDWSHALLNAAQQRAFRRLGVCSGGFSLEMARQMLSRPLPLPLPHPASSDTSDVWTAIDWLGDLVDCSLVSVDAGDPPRYRLLETSRAHALDRLARSGEVDAARCLHAHVVRDLFEQAYEDGWQLGEAAFLGRYEAELDNLRAALDWALRHDPVCAVALAGSSARLWRYLSLHPEALRRCVAAQGLLDEATPPVLAARLWESSAQLMGEISNTESGVAAARAAELYARIGDRRGRYVALAHLAFSYRVSPKAEAAFAEMRQLEDPTWPAAVRILGAKVEGGLATVAGHISLAVAANERRLALATRLGWERDMYAALGNLADVALVAGDPVKAVRLGQDLLSRLSRRHQVTRAIALGNLLLAWLAWPDIAQAHACAVEFLRANRPLDNMYLNWSADALALLAAQQGRWSDAARWLGYTEAVYSAEGAEREPNEERAYSQAGAMLREHAETDAHRAAVAEGRALTLAAAAEHAWRELRDPPQAPD